MRAITAQNRKEEHFIFTIVPRLPTESRNSRKSGETESLKTTGVFQKTKSHGDDAITKVENELEQLDLSELYDPQSYISKSQKRLRS